MSGQAALAIRPEVGMGATIEWFVDREPATVVQVDTYRSGALQGQPKEVRVQLDAWDVCRGSETHGTAEYVFSPDPAGRTMNFVLARKGQFEGSWVEKGSKGRGCKLMLGTREYRNPPLFS